MKRVFFGLVWCVVFYFVGCMLAGAVAGGIAGYHHPEAAAEAGRLAGIKVVQEYRPFIIFGAVTLAVLGSGAGYLPGTKGREEQYPDW